MSRSFVTFYLSLFTTRGVLRSPIYCFVFKKLNPRKSKWYHLLASSAKARRVRGQPSNDASQFIRSANPAERVQARPLIQQVRLRVQIRRGHPEKKIWSAFMKLLPLLPRVPRLRPSPDRLLVPLRAVLVGFIHSDLRGAHPTLLKMNMNMCIRTKCICVPD